MGSSYSEPVQDASNAGLGVFAISLSPYDKVRLIHAPQEVIAATQKVVNEVNSLFKGRQCEDSPHVKYGIIQFKLSDSAFVVNNGKKAATLGKLFCFRMFEELYKLGCDILFSSDLARMKDQSTWFVRKVTSERQGRRVICLAPSKLDTITLLKHDDRVKSKVFEAIVETWPKGYKHWEDVRSLNQDLFEIKLNGNPWNASDSEVDSKRLLSFLVGKMSELNMRLLVGTNIKGGTDSLFFIEDTEAALRNPHNFSSISLHKKDRLRLVDCKDMADDVRLAILQNGNSIQEETKREYHHKFKIKGTPWWSSGDEALRSRRLISRIAEKMLLRGWALTDAVDTNRGLDDKSVLLFSRCHPTSARFTCVALTDVDHLRLVDFPQGDLEVLQGVINQTYQPGISRFEIDPADPGCVKIHLSGEPWNSMGDYALHGRSMLVHLLSRAIHLGYMVVASADVSAKIQTDSDGNPDYPLDVHTWYFVKY